MNYLLSTNAIHFTTSQGVPYVVARSDKAFKDVVDAIKAGKDESTILDLLEKEKRVVEEAAKKGAGFTLENGAVYHNGERVAGVIESRILEMIKEGFSLDPMNAFMDNLKQNPSYRVREQLYAFLEKGGCAITEDGCFLTYKAIREDWKDIHSGRFDNSIGKVVSMPRTHVDDDPNRTCSAGLHVCSFDYLPHFSHANGHVVCCKVNPKDVVSIPADYNNTKMRVCEYEVVSEYKGYYEGQGDLLRGSVAMPSADGTGLKPLFEVQVLWTDARDSDDFSAESGHTHLREAFAEFLEYDETNEDVVTVRIVNTSTGEVLDTLNCAGELECSYSSDDNSYTTTENYDRYVVLDESDEEILESEQAGDMTQDEAIQLAVSINCKLQRETGAATLLKVVYLATNKCIFKIS